MAERKHGVVTRPAGRAPGAGLAGGAGPATYAGWLDRLRLACEALSRSPQAGLRALSVTGRISGEAQGWEALAALSGRLAEEYGLDWEASGNGNWRTIRYRRRQVSGTDGADPAP